LTLICLRSCAFDVSAQERYAWPTKAAKPKSRVPLFSNSLIRLPPYVRTQQIQQDFCATLNFLKVFNNNSGISRATAAARGAHEVDLLGGEEFQALDRARAADHLVVLVEDEDRAGEEVEPDVDVGVVLAVGRDVAAAQPVGVALVFEGLRLALGDLDHVDRARIGGRRDRARALVLLEVALEHTARHQGLDSRDDGGTEI
jgi:hypothetical protein